MTKRLIQERFIRLRVMSMLLRDLLHLPSNCLEEEFTLIDIHVQNETTGHTWYSTTDISDGMGEIGITNGNVGFYSVEIITEYGECFIGDFRL